MSLGNMTRLDSITAVPIDKIRDLANSLAGKFIDLRWAMFTLPAEYDRNLLSKMYSLSEWNRTFKRCPRCASFLSRCAAKTSAACGYCQSVFYPPISPAIICLVTNRENSHALLVHLPRSPNTVYTLIAGYVQNGESLVEAVRREVGEEAGVDCDEIVQLNMSQSWPIQNNSIMCAFRAVADPKQKLDICKNELLAANWFSREEVQWAFDNTTRNLNHINESIPPKFQFIYVPPYGALSNRMIKHWLGEKP
ncbi:unnamed protein product [Dracunculus medinensis]|uniref:NAD(+) diphosphatase n=1 Tax=Dracunculus medinensis TaxID=318479 RepID=A0A3P7PRM2_DRAME|nr:unnamed protein product [Dracunculus medinensis]